MDKATTISNTNDQTHDFMKVDSFSQLPFLRPSPFPNKDKSSSSSSSGLRLFGIDFSSSTTATNENSNSDDTTNKEETNDDDNNNNNNNNIENGESGRKFECHYCCRNFPTSQALGGHQNAHKRERQHAKRAHLHSTMMAADPHNHHLYNHLVNYSSHHNYNHHHPPTNSSYTQNYHSTLTNTSRFSYHPTTTTRPTPSNFSNLHHAPPTINGNPLMWRVPTTVHSSGIHRDRSLHPPLPYFNGTPTSKVLNIDKSSSKNSMSMNMNMSSPQSQVGRRANSDHVSLDLRL